jgi:hypothetical protein
MTTRLTMLLALALAGLALAPTASARQERPLNADLVGVFEFGPCPAGAPTGASCLSDQVSGAISNFGDSTGKFDVVIDTLAIGSDGCSPAEKHGSFVSTRGDRLDVTATGKYCWATSTATYAFTITGGSGRFAAASGSGTWLVPAPREFDGTGGVGDEYLRGTIVRR